MSAPAAPTVDADGLYRCPRCQATLTTLGDEVPWCPHCQWNLGAYRPMFPREGIVGSLNRRAHAIGFRQGPQIVRELAGQEVHRPVATTGSRVLAVTSIVLYAVIASLFAGGLWLLSRLRPPEFLLGLLVTGLAWMLRPRLARRRRLMKLTWELDRDQAPALFELLDRIAGHIGARTPETVAYGVHWNLSLATYGLRRRTAIIIGLPLFVSAQPQERVAMLAHELAHQVNGDARRGLVNEPALTVFGRLAQATWWRIPEQLVHPAYVLAAMVMRVVSYALFAAHLGLNLLGSRESRRAEHYADALAARAAGTRAAQSMMDLLVFSAEMERLIDGIAQRPPTGEGWKKTVDAARERWSRNLVLRRQLTLRREASAFASHPPVALRHQLLASTPYHDPAVVLTDEQARRLDRELQGYVIAYDRFLRQLAGPRSE